MDRDLGVFRSCGPPVSAFILNTEEALFGRRKNEGCWKPCFQHFSSIFSAWFPCASIFLCNNASNCSACVAGATCLRRCIVFLLVCFRSGRSLKLWHPCHRLLDSLLKSCHAKEQAIKGYIVSFCDGHAPQVRKTKQIQAISNNTDNTDTQWYSDTSRLVLWTMATASSCIWMITGTVPNFPGMRGTFPLWLHWAPLKTGSPLRDFKLKFPDPRPFVQKHGLHLRDLWDLGGFGWFWWFSDWFQKVLKVEAFGAPGTCPMPNARTQDWSLALFLCPSWGRKAMDSRLQFLHLHTASHCNQTAHVLVLFLPVSLSRG